MGYKDTEEWTQHEENFSALLENLSQATESNNDGTTETKLSSLEEKSKSSRARLHYKKFMRGKDLSRYSEKDIANIFGKKTLKACKKEEIATEEEESKEETDVHSFGVETKNGGSMTDYFKNKMKSFSLNAKNDSESETEATFGFGFKENTVEELEEKTKRKNEKEEDNITDEDDNNRKKKRKHKIIECEVAEIVKKKKKKKKSKEL